MRDDEIPRIVKPRKPVLTPLPIIAIHGDEIYVERTQGHHLLERLPAIIVEEPSSIIVVHGAGDMLAKLHARFADNPQWQYKVTPVEREVWNPENRGPKCTLKTVVVNFLGFTSSSKRAGKSKYHYPLDPMVFVNKTAPEIRGRNDVGEALEGTLLALFHWAQDVRDFVLANELRLSPTSGGLASQLLRDSRFYPQDRRKVPKATNARAREVLPGNFYKLNADTERYYRAVYLDQENAHHSCARDLEFPHADRLFAKGHFDRDGCDGCDGLWSRAGTRHFAKIIQQPGLFRLRLRVPIPIRGRTVPPYMEKPGAHDVWVYSNELEMIRRLGGRIEGIIAAWTSTTVDKGLNRYAQWAVDQLEGQPRETREWLKPTLLSTYGILAAKPRHREFGYLRSKGGVATELPVGAEMLPVKMHKTSRQLEANFANVIHRGMIEAETRRRSIELANDLHAGGLEIIAVYADSVFARRNGPLPLLPAGWSVKHDLDGLRFLNPVSFTSRQLTKLPGVPKELQDRHLESRPWARRYVRTSGHFSVRPGK